MSGRGEGRGARDEGQTSAHASPHELLSPQSTRMRLVGTLSTASQIFLRGICTGTRKWGRCGKRPYRPYFGSRVVTDLHQRAKRDGPARRQSVERGSVRAFGTLYAPFYGNENSK